MAALAVIPAFNEERLIASTVSSLLSTEGVGRVVVLDDASADGTAMAAEEAGATVVANGRNLGKGASLNRLLPLMEFDVLLLVDGDLGRHAAEAGLLLEPVLSGEADLAIAAFGSPAVRGGFGAAKGLGRRGIRMLGGAEMRTPLSGQRAMTGEAFRMVFPFAPGFGMEVGMTIDALRAGLRVVEVPTGMSHEETGRDLAGFVHRGRQFRDILLALLARSGRRRAC